MSYKSPNMKRYDLKNGKKIFNGAFVVYSKSNITLKEELLNTLQKYNNNISIINKSKLLILNIIEFINKSQYVSGLINHTNNKQYIIDQEYQFELCFTDDKKQLIVEINNHC
jgi:hypothetical protein